MKILQQLQSTLKFIGKDPNISITELSDYDYQILRVLSNMLEFLKFRKVPIDSIAYQSSGKTHLFTSPRI